MVLTHEARCNFGPWCVWKIDASQKTCRATGIPLIELDKVFWQVGLVAMPRNQWVAIQEQLVSGDRWVMDGDLGSHDALEVRLRAADTIVFLDFPLVRCAWRALRRSRERFDFWAWLVAYRWRYRPLLLRTIATHARGAELQTLRSPAEVAGFLQAVERRAIRT